MSPPPTWLPAMVSTNGEWPRVCSMLYGIFTEDFINTQRDLSGKPVWWDRSILPGERYEEGFWHLITKVDHTLGDRILDPRRAERLPWCGPTITNATDPIVKVWSYKESGRRPRTYVWLENLDYVIILEQRRYRRGDIAFLVTAYHVDGDSQRRSLRNKFARRMV